MKALIIGGGIGGLSMAIGLRRAGWETLVAERLEDFTDKGLGFILLPSGLQALEWFGAGSRVKAYGRSLQSIVMRRPDGEIIQSNTLPASISVKRSICIQALRSQLPKEIIKTGYDFSRFDYDSHGLPRAARFRNGESLAADLFIAADGANSHIRKLFFPHNHTTPTVVKELVGVAEAPEIARFLGNRLLKTQSDQMGLSFGMLPSGASQVIWYMQYDCQRWDLHEHSTEAKEKFALERMAGWADPISALLRQTDFGNTYVWFTKDMDLLPSFHYKNIVLLGDAAHVALPFTSQGANSALEDALLLSQLLEEEGANFEEIFTKYYQIRKEDIERYIHFGRLVADRFLSPLLYVGHDPLIPMIK